VPFLPAAQLVRMYGPLADALESITGRPVQLSTAPDFVTFLRRARAHAYEVLVTGPAFARYCQVDAGYDPLLVSRQPVYAVALVRADGPLAAARSLAPLRGRAVATMEPITVIAQLGDEMLRQAGLRPGVDVAVTGHRSPFNAVQAMLIGEADAAIVTASVPQRLPDALAAQVAEIARSRPLPGVVLMARPAADLPGVAGWRAQLDAYFATAAGRAFAGQPPHGGFRVPSEEELRRLDVFLAPIRRALAR
jgi:phosphonate transport system substrate-binding protein